MFFKKKTEKPLTTIDITALQSNLEKSRKLNASMAELSTGFLAGSEKMLSTRKEVKRV